MNQMNRLRGAVSVNNNLDRLRGVVPTDFRMPVYNSGSPNTILAELQTAVNDFTQRHDARVEQLAAGLDDVNRAMAALRLGGGVSGGDSEPVSPASRREFVAELSSFVRDRSSQAHFMPKAAASTDNDPAGGYTVEPVLSPTIKRKVFDVSPIARLARRETIGAGNSFEEVIDPSDTDAAWVGERQARPATTDPQLKKLLVPVHEIYANQPATQRLLDDSRFDIGGWLEGKISDKFARSEGQAYINGDGILRPRGILSYSIVTTKDATRDWFAIQYVPSGVAAALSDSSHNGVDPIYDLVYSLRAPYRPNARFLMNLATAGVVRKFKDLEGRFLWADARDGLPAMLAGFPVEIDEQMPDIGANQYPIAFGDFQQAYIIVEKPGIRMLRDPFTDKPNVLFYAYRRVGGGLQCGEAVKLLKVAAT